MSKYIDDLSQQLKGKNIQAFTEELKASRNLSKILKDQAQKEKQAEAKKKIQAMLKQ